ncbi:unnamed protein product [Penicillium roqueforti FM164]|uniref:Genomic scaffold, ProqFM164S01 n=1 Tax=Penicillium roqueforti (strain FM164) TaxID=1365484 RepID=W6PUE7_PENRF|nr:unnamed protein product [Penicillium roqueforti FM164]
MEDAGRLLPGTPKQQRESFGARDAARKKAVEGQYRLHGSQCHLTIRQAEVCFVSSEFAASTRA